MDDAISRFWDKYLAKTVSYKVPGRSRQWYVRRVEVCINAHSGRRLASLSVQRCGRLSGRDIQKRAREQ